MYNSNIQFVLILGALSKACITLLGSCARAWCCLCSWMPAPSTIALLGSPSRQLLPRLHVLMLRVPLCGTSVCAHKIFPRNTHFILQKACTDLRLRGGQVEEWNMYRWAPACRELGASFTLIIVGVSRGRFLAHSWSWWPTEILAEFMCSIHWVDSVSCEVCAAWSVPRCLQKLL